MTRKFGTERQPVEWSNIPASNISQASDATAIGGNLTTDTRFTIRRIRGSFIVRLDGTLAAGDNIRVGIGLIKANADAITLGATAMPDPLGETDAPWLYYYQTNLTMVAAATSATWDQNTAGPGFVRVDVDSKAMRILRPREGIIWVVQVGNVTGQPPVVWDIAETRVLIGLH